MEERAGVERRGEVVTSGVPFPMGGLRNDAQVRLLDAKAREVPLQVRTTATWKDGSVKWLLLDFQTDVDAGKSTQYFLEYGAGVRRARIPGGVTVENEAHKMVIGTGPLRFEIAKERFGIFQNTFLDIDGKGTFEAGENVARKGFAPVIALAGLKAEEIVVHGPEEMVIEEPGPLHAVIKVSGWVDVGTTNRALQYIARVHAYAGSTAVPVDFTLVQKSDAKMLWLEELALRLETDFPGAMSCVAGGAVGEDGVVVRGDSQFSAEVLQLTENEYRISTTNGSGSKGRGGFKASGWMALRGTNSGVLVGNRHFWQQFPKGISARNNELRIELYPRKAGKAFDFDQGLAKTHELYFEWSPKAEGEGPKDKLSAWEHPLFAQAPASWYCDSKVFGELHPFDFDLFPDYETLTEASGDQFIKRMATGFRHWGDYYYGGEYKGTNSYMNLEYDVHHNFYCQFARTGLRKYLDTAFIMGKHQADIDTNHKTGWQWKHSPRHVEIQAEFGHTFTRGLLETYFFTGNRRCFDAAIELGDYFAKQIRVPRELGNERQIGWSLISLLPVYEATWDKKYLEAAKETIDRLLAGLDEKGKFKIRWDNRIAFFNGIAATGFIYYYRATGDERVAEAAMKVIRRTRGFYPEYAGRTLEAIAWAYERGRDPEDLDFLQRTWETTMARQISWNVMELGAPTIFTVHALPFMARSGFFPKTERPLNLTPEQFSSDNGFYVHHLPAGEAGLFLRNTTQEPLDIVIIRKGAWKSSASAVVYGPSGKTVGQVNFPKDPVVWQRKVVSLSPSEHGTYRVELKSETQKNAKGGSYVTWDVATSRPVAGVFNTARNEGLQFVTPYLFAKARPGASKISIDLIGEGEGFKKATIFDPTGRSPGQWGHLSIWGTRDVTSIT